MTISTYDRCILIATSDYIFSMVRMQTDDTMILSDNKFSGIEKTELAKAGFSAKLKEKLRVDQPLS